MKSAYELAMERLSKSDPSTARPLTAEQRGRLADIDKRYLAKAAERDIFLKQRLDEAFVARNAEDIDKIKKQMSSEKARLDEEMEAEKDRVRSGKA